MAVSHVFTSPVADKTGTVTFWDGATTASAAASDIVKPGNWNSVHNQYYTLTGDTLGNSTVSGTNVLFGGSNGVQVSGSSNSIFFVGKIHSGFEPYNDLERFAGQAGQATLLFNPVMFPNVQFDRLVIPINTNPTNSSGSHTISQWVGLYTKNSSTMSLLSSTSNSIAATHSGTVGSYSLYSGMRLVTIPWTMTVTQGQYYIGYVSRTTSGGANGTYSNLILSNLATNFLGHWSSSHNTTYQFVLGQGVYTATTSGMPASVGFSQLRGSDSTIPRAPILYFASGTV
jgi:hypothetical protein